MSDQLAYDLGAYVQELMAERDGIQRLLAENNPWPDNVFPNGDWHKGHRDALENVISRLGALIQRPS